MAYGTIKIDTITFTDGGVDKSVSISGLVQNSTFSGNITVTGTVSGNTICGQTVSGVTVTGTTALFSTGTFISLTGTTSQGTTATYTSGSFTSLTGVTTSGTTANFVSGVFSTQISGATVTGNAGAFTTLTGGVTTVTSGVFAAGSASNPSISFTSDPNTGIYSPGADQVAISTSSSERIRIGANGEIGLGGANYGTNGQVLTSAGSGAAPTWQTPAAGNADKIEEGNSSAEVIDTGSDGRFVVTTEGSERARVDSSGRLLVGTSTNLGSAEGYEPRLQVAGSTQGLSIGRYQANNPYGAQLYLQRSKSDTVGGHAVMASGDEVGYISFEGSDGTAFKRAAAITALVDGTPGTNDMPGRLVFSTTADGASSPTERMRIRNDGSTSLYSTTSVIELRSAAAAGGALEILNGYHSATSTSNGTRSVLIATNGNIQNTNNSYGAISDIKLKENIVDANSQWNDLKALQVRNYNFKEETGQQTHTQLGLIAQEVELVSPGLVSESPDRDLQGNDLGTTTKSVNYSVLYMKAVKALQEAMERIETLEAKVAALESA